VAVRRARVRGLLEAGVERSAGRETLEVLHAGLRSRRLLLGGNVEADARVVQDGED